MAKALGRELIEKIVKEMFHAQQGACVEEAQAPTAAVVDQFATGSGHRGDAVLAVDRMSDSDTSALVKKLRAWAMAESRSGIGRQRRELLMAAADEIDELCELVRSFVLDEIDYMTRNKLGDAEQQHNVKWARKLGIMDKTGGDDVTASDGQRDADRA